MKLPTLKTTLYANTVFSTSCAVLMLAVPGWFTANVMDVPSLVYTMLGAGLLVFALDVFCAAYKLPNSRNSVWFIFWGEVIWVVGTPVLLIAFAERITSLGNWLLIDIAVIVGAFAVLEYRSLKAVNTLDSNQAPV